MIYIDGLVKECTFAHESSRLYLYADDAKLFSSCPSDLQNALDLVHKWTKNRQLSLAPTKCEQLTIYLS